MEDLTKTSSPALSDDTFLRESSDMISRDCIPFLPHSASEMNGGSISSSQSPSFGYIPIVLDANIEESFQDSSSAPVSDAAFSYLSWVDEAWNVDNKPLSMLGSTSGNDYWEIGDSSERDEAFGGFCNLSPEGYEDLSSGSSKSTCEAESNNQCSVFAPASGVVSSSESSDESSEEARNARDIEQRNESLSISQGPPDITITAWNDQGSRRPQVILDVMQTTSLEQPGSSVKPFLQNPIQFHCNNSGEIEFLVRLSYNEVQTRMPEWLKLYQEQLELLEKESKIPGSRARLPKRKKET